jgi:hypothetical protein
MYQISPSTKHRNDYDLWYVTFNGKVIAGPMPKERALESCYNFILRNGILTDERGASISRKAALAQAKLPLAASRLVDAVNIPNLPDYMRKMLVAVVATPNNLERAFQARVLAAEVERLEKVTEQHDRQHRSLVKALDTAKDDFNKASTKIDTLLASASRAPVADREKISSLVEANGHANVASVYKRSPKLMMSLRGLPLSGTRRKALSAAGDVGDAIALLGQRSKAQETTQRVLDEFHGRPKAQSGANAQGIIRALRDALGERIMSASYWLTELAEIFEKFVLPEELVSGAVPEAYCRQVEQRQHEWHSAVAEHDDEYDEDYDDEHGFGRV